MKLTLAPEVRAALAAKRPVVALESSVLAQGLPAPHNIEAHRRCEAAIRAVGAVPAAIAVVKGALRVGLSESDVSTLTTERGLMKVGLRDLAIAIEGRATGGTTVSATCAVAAAAGIRLFATGGIGGVHRGAAESFDESTDLGAMRRYPVAVVCAGAKSVLDLPATLERLETLGVPVYGFGTHELPSFFSVESGLTLEHRLDDAGHAARVLKTHFDEVGEGGALIAVPPPSKTALSKRAIDRQVAAALKTAAKKGIVGKAVTPFLLGELTARTKGKTLVANLALLENNARVAAEIAKAWPA